MPNNQSRSASCPIPCDYIPIRSWPLFEARLLQAAPEKPQSEKTIDPNISDLERRLSEHLGAPAEIRHGQRGKGQIILRYGSLDELDALLSRLTPED